MTSDMEQGTAYVLQYMTTRQGRHKGLNARLWGAHDKKKIKKTKKKTNEQTKLMKHEPMKARLILRKQDHMRGTGNRMTWNQET